ncbi:MAG: hypothetical protein ACR2JO_02060 [Mycobacteriales bacterium]
MNGRRADLLAGFLLGRWRGGLGAAPRVTFVVAVLGIGVGWRLLHSSAVIVFAVILAAVILAAVAVEALSGRPGGCQCGHPRDWHHHFRPGSDCSACHCLRFQR